MNECCFVWGPPLSGQRYWMVRAADETDAKVRTVLMPLESQNPQTSLEEVLAHLGVMLQEHSVDGQNSHIYCELPWSVTDDSLSLEEWIESRPEFSPESSRPWNVSFVCVCPADADRLPEAYRRQIEEFSRASQSAVIIARREGDESELDWIDTDLLNFSKKTEIFEEDLWPQSVGAERESAPHPLNVTEMQTLTLPVSGDRTSYMDLFQDLVHGYYGPIWGAEACWKNSRGEFEALTISQGKLFSWVSDSVSLLQNTPLNGALLSLVGGNLRRQDLILALRSQSFC